MNVISQFPKKIIDLLCEQVLWTCDVHINKKIMWIQIDTYIHTYIHIYTIEIEQ